jgi:transcriptional antiterminator NusG
MKKEKKEEVEEIELNQEILNLVVEDEDNPDLKWYFVQTQSNCEKRATLNIEQAVLLAKLEDRVKKIFNPSVQVVEMRDGKKRTVNKKLYPGYILVFADMNNDVFHAVSKAQKVTGFLSKTAGSLLPRPAIKKEIKTMFDKLKEYTNASDDLYNIKAGSVVRIKDGAFTDHEGVISLMEIDKGTAKVSISILGKNVDMSIQISSLELVAF